MSLLMLFAALGASAQERFHFPGATWDVVDSPSTLGWSERKLAEARAFAESIDTDSVFIVHHGYVIARWGHTARRLPCHSMRKGLMSLMVGIHVDAGAIDVDATLAELEIDDTIPLTDAEKQATVADLMTSRSGIYLPAALEPADVAANRPARGSHAPGTFWYYNNWDFNAVLTIFEQETGAKFFEDFHARVAEPLQLESFKIRNGSYQSVDGSVHRGYPFWMTAEDLGRIGLLMARGGKWNDAQIVSKEWIAKSTTPVADTGEKGGFGMMWYASMPDKGVLFGADVGKNVFGTAGYGGHYLVVVPGRDLVVVHRVNTIIPNKFWVDDEEFSQLLEMILNARIEAATNQERISSRR